MNFGLGCIFIAVEYNDRCAAALTTSLNNTGRHGQVTKSLMKSQIHQLKLRSQEHQPRVDGPSHHHSNFLLK
eukprot:1144146-Pelagomonas_calceolata.AAC.1